MEIKTRFAPSPTGELHIGNAWTALFEYLFAKSQNGQFLLRIEDTDRERFVEGADKRIIESIKWLGIIPENVDSYFAQSSRLEIYQKHARQLVDDGKAYICTCSKERITQAREEQQKAGQPPKYPGYCREAGIKFADVEEGEYVVRLKMPKAGKTVVHDLIRGDVEFDLSLIDDQVLLKSDGFPTYHLAAIVDDHEMQISHVIRAEEWLPSTPKHLVIYEDFGWKAPEFAHLPMILAPDRSKLSKRHGATSVVEFKNLGYLPEAMINFMALMGWNPGDKITSEYQEHFLLQDLVKLFNIKDVNKSPAIFDIEKLNSINEYYLRNKSTEELQELLKEFEVENPTDEEANLIKRGGYKTVKEAADYINKIRQITEYDPSLLIFKKSDKETTTKGLELVFKEIENLQQFNDSTIQQLLSTVVENNSLSNGDVFWPVRVALSGEEKSPSPVELALILGKDKTLARIKKAISILQ